MNKGLSNNKYQKLVRGKDQCSNALMQWECRKGSEGRYGVEKG